MINHTYQIGICTLNIVVKFNMADFDTDMHFSFSDKKLYDYSEINWNNKLSDKTKRDEYFYMNSEDTSQYQFEGMRWK